MRDTVKANGITIAFRQEGMGSDLVLTHGLGGDLTYWDAHIPVFARHHRVLAWDVRGFGASNKPPGPYSPELFAADLAELLRALGIARAHFAGISMGGVITQRLALDRPDLPLSLVLISTSSQVGEAASRGWQALADQVEKNGLRPSIEATARGFSPDFARRNPDLIAELSRQTGANDPHAYAAAARGVSAYSWTDRLMEIRSPTLIIQGMDDQLTPPGGSVIMSRNIPHARLLMFPAAGHNLPIEQPLAFQSAVLAFTGGVDLALSAGL